MPVYLTDPPTEDGPAPRTCEGCGDREQDVRWRQWCDSYLCNPCHATKETNALEAQDEANQRQFHGGSSAFTPAEQLASAYKRVLERRRG